MSKKTRKEFDELRRDLHKAIDDMTEDSAMLLCADGNSDNGKSIVAIRGSTKRITEFVAAAVGSIIEGAELSPVQAKMYLDTLQGAINTAAAKAAADTLANMSEEERNAVIAEMIAQVSAGIESMTETKEDAENADD